MSRRGSTAGVMVPVLRRGGDANRGEARLYLDQRMGTLHLRKPSGSVVNLERREDEQGQNWHYRHIVGDYTITAADGIVGVDTASGVVAITMPTAVGQPGRVVTIKREAGSAKVNINAQIGQTIEGGSTVALNVPGSAVNIYSNGTSWFIF